MSKLAAVSMRVTNAPNYDEPRDAIAHDMIHWLADAGFSAVPIPNTIEDVRAHLDAVKVDAVVLTGGNNLVEAAPGDPDVSEQRTKTELAMIAYAIKSKTPLLGICRGMHIINKHFSGSIDAKMSDNNVPHVAVNHRVRISSPFAQFSNGGAITTNSFHNQGFRQSQVADDLDVFATCEGDETVEGLTHNELPILAVQWHPERPNPAASFDQSVLMKFLKEGQFWLS